MRKKRLFISYSVVDKKIVKRIVSDLHQWGYDIWIYPESILPGEKIVESEEKGIISCDHVLLMLSENAKNSSPVQRERELAKTLFGQKKYIYCRINNEAPLWSDEGIQICDLYPSQNYTKEMLRLIKSIDSVSDFYVRSKIKEDEIVDDEQWYNVSIWIEGGRMDRILDVTYHLHPDIILDENTDWKYAAKREKKYKLTFYTTDPEIIYCVIDLKDGTHEEIRHFLKLTAK